MRPLVTGAAGFIGSAIVRGLIARGYHPRALVRPDSNRRALRGLDIEIAMGDIRDQGSVERALAGCDTIFHAAADYRLWVPDPATMESINVEGTRTVIEAARRHGIDRVVHTSSVGTLGIPGDGTPGTEETPVTIADMTGPYKRSKFLAERIARDAASQGVPVVIVHPSTPVGPFDVRPTPTGKMIVDFMRGRMPAFLDTGLNIVDVDDCAEGHILAAERGVIGRSYILGGENLTLREIFAILSPRCGIPAPRIKLPHAPVLLLARIMDVISRFTGREPFIPLDGVRMARTRMFFSSRRAEEELSYRHRPARDALWRAVDWFRAEGYA